MPNVPLLPLWIGCSSPVAAYAYFENDKLVLKGLCERRKNIAIKGIEYGRAGDAVKMAFRLQEAQGRRADFMKVFVVLVGAGRATGGF